MKALKNISTDTIVSIDIETVRVTDEFSKLSEGFQESWEYKNKQDGEIPEHRELESMWKKNSSLYAEFSKVCAVSLVLLHNDRLNCMEFYGTDEQKLLSALSVTLGKLSLSNPNYRLVGHSAKFFDYPYLAKRYIINGMDIPDILDVTALKPWEGRNLCTNELWKCGGTGAGSSLQALCNALDIPGSKVDLVGDEVGKAYFDGQYERIARYCSYDAVADFNVVRRFKHESIFKFDEVVYVKRYSDGDEVETAHKNLLQELYMNKDFGKAFQAKLKKQLKERNLKPEHKDVLKRLTKAAYLEKVPLMGLERKNAEDINEIRDLEVEEFFKRLKL